MWRDQPFNQRNKTAGRAVGLGVGDDREGGWGLDKISSHHHLLQGLVPVSGSLLKHS